MNRFAHFVSDWVARAAAEERGPPAAASADRFHGAVLMCDVSGFTALGERLAERGPEGAELLWRTVNGYFGQILERIRAHGGDVLRFAGDAPIALWRDEGGEDAARRAAACGLELQTTLGRWPGPEGVELSIRSAVAAGPLLAARVGGVGGRWEAIVGGAPFSDLASALAEAERGQLLVSALTFRALGPEAVGRRTPGGSWLLERVAASEPRPLVSPDLDASTEPALRAHMAPLVVDRVLAGLRGWLGELRTVSVVFVGLEGVDYTSEGALGALDAVARAAQQEIARYDGDLNQFLVDDKGTVLLAAWGLPGCTHEDDAERAVRWAQAMERALGDLGLRTRIGVSSGRAFCGPKGDAGRSEYGLLGAEVNLAARLMQRSDGRPFCSPSTRRAAEGRLAFQAVGDFTLKGRQEPVRAWTPRGREVADTQSFRALIGRSEELGLLMGALFDADGKPGVIHVRGEAGIGKSTLLTGMVREARRRGRNVVVGEADPIERSTPYHAFQAVFLDLLGLTGLPADARAAGAREAFANHPERLRLLPLFNPVLGLDLPDNEDTAGLDADGRSHLTVQGCSDVLASAGPAIIVLDDVHWMDSASWELLRRMRSHAALRFVLGSRPLDPTDHASTVLSGLDVALALDLGPLAREDLGRLVAARLGADEVDDTVMSVITTRSEGHPFFAEEIALVLRDRGLLAFEGGRCGAASSAGDLSAVELPATLEALIAGRLDVLGPTEQLSLKTAAVVGRSFPLEMVRDIFPIAIERPRVRAALDRANDLGLTRVEAPDPDPSWLFKHAVTRDVAYGQLLYQQRRELHAAAAAWVEARTEGAGRPWPLLAYHWRQAEVRDRAIDALEAAGEHAFRSFAPREAIGFLEAALELDAAGEPSPPARRARWERVLGEAKARIGRLGEADGHLARAVALLGHPIPGNRFSLGVAFLAECARQVWRRYLGPPRPVTSGREALIDTANAYAELGLNAYFAGDLLKLLFGTMRALNLVEGAGESPDLARLKAGMAVVVASVPMHGAAHSYSREALATAARFDDANAAANAQHYRGAFLCGLGTWEEAQSLFEPAAEGYARCGNIRRYDEVVQCLAHTHMNRGAYAAAGEAMETLLRSARDRGDPQGVFWGEAVRVEWLWRQGRLRDAVDALEAIDVAGASDEIFRARVSGLRAHLAIDQGDLVAARAAVAPLLPQQRGASFVQLWAYTAVPALELSAWESGLADRRAAAKAAVKVLEGFAGTFPVALPYAGVARGRLEALEGRKDRADAAFAKAAADARERDMPLEEAQALERQAALGLPSAAEADRRARALRDRLAEARAASVKVRPAEGA